jgi:glycosyltransferase involved in cell wall biosynthesis
MNLLVLNAATDRHDSGLEVAVEWLEALARRVDRVEVVTNRLGLAPESRNIHVRSLGAERGRGRAARTLSLYGHLHRILGTTAIDCCFVHMVPQLGVLAAPLLKSRGIPMVQWYTHRAVPWSLRMAYRVADRVVTASRESISIRGSKVIAIGHGIDTARFTPGVGAARGRTNTLRLITVGRVAPSKRLDDMVTAVDIARRHGVEVVLDVFGEPRNAEGTRYAERLRQRVVDGGLQGIVCFRGGVRREQLIDAYRSADVCVNLSDTDSVDKAVLEAMSCGVPTVTSNRAFVPLLQGVSTDLVVPKSDCDAVARSLLRIASWPPAVRQSVAEKLRAIVVADHDLERLADALVRMFTGLQRAA